VGRGARRGQRPLRRLRVARGQSGGDHRGIAAFFGIDAPGLPTELLKENDTARYQRSRRASGIAEKIKSFPLVGPLSRAMPRGVRDAGWNALRRSVSASPAPASGGLTPEVRAFITERIADDAERFRRRHADPGRWWIGPLPFDRWSA